ncbi:hypothetical protein F3Y22_tig00110450pilonHSYRG01058 [Hibiscus syriacus]|uniref:Protein FAR1-RELATED SEQUENCE n=1 Tax=Hibiscus syriacus TaxID=106335 RepID=A0A6A3AJ58_HIBSY|nr:hypothetical protein F3Y22_tig00110450pilonHSYRG01058 [Hibiscus syriacus]
MDNTDVDNVKPTEECHEVHNVENLTDWLVSFCSRDQAWYFYKGFVREHGAVSKADIDEANIERGRCWHVTSNEYLTQQAGGYHMLDLHIKTSTMHFKENFLEAMMNKSPISVVTDGDRAMQRAIKSVIPYAKHRLCSWHLSRNAQANIGDPKFIAAFSKCMASWCESMNASLAIALKHKKTYLDVRAIEDGISRMCMNELKADYLSSHTKPFQITNWSTLKACRCDFYPRIFSCFQDEFIRETLYRIEAEIKSLSDECQHYICQNRGLPCRHQLHILKQLDYTYLPGTLIQSRWTNDAKASAPSYVDLNVSPEVMQMARFAALRSTSSRLCYIASKTDESFKTARDEMKKLIEELENSFGLNDSVNQSIVVNNVRDPQRKQRKRKEVPKNKVEKKIRRCGYCNGEGHNKLTCPQVKFSLSTSTQPTSTDFFEDGME